MTVGDTIAAISSSVGPAARMIVRLSGPSSFSIAATLTDSPMPHPAAAMHRLHIEDLTFPAWIYSFRAPNSATGEDVIEFHIPGNPLLARMVLDHLIASGARQAEPGEFTARSYFNGRIDMAAAEGVAATIAAQSERELSAARQLLSGELARRLTPMMELLAETLALTEVGIDFADEDVTVLTPGQTADRIEKIDTGLADLLARSSRFESLTHEPIIVLVGRPNAGKSTLLNALAGIERAVVSPLAGTTRDVLSADIALRRGTIKLLDVAGLEDSPATEPISSQMHAAAVRAMETADLIVLLRESIDDRPEISLPRAPDVRILSKCDLLPPSPGTPGEGRGEGDSGLGDRMIERLGDWNCRSSITQSPNHPITQFSIPNHPHPNPLPEYRERESIAISVQTGTGITEFLDHLDTLAFGATTANASLALNARHVRAINDARNALSRADPTSSPELIATELRDALDSLGSILGSVTPDDVIGKIFSTFCIGK